MTPYAIPNNSYLVNNALKGAKGPPDLICGRLFEPGAGCEGGIPIFFWGIAGYVYLRTFLLNDL